MSEPLTAHLIREGAGWEARVLRGRELIFMRRGFDSREEAMLWLAEEVQRRSVAVRIERDDSRAEAGS